MVADCWVNGITRSLNPTQMVPKFDHLQVDPVFVRTKLIRKAQPATGRTMKHGGLRISYLFMKHDGTVYCQNHIIRSLPSSHGNSSGKAGLRLSCVNKNHIFWQAK